MTASVAIIGAGPAGLMAAELLSAKNIAVTVYDRMPSVGRKFLIAGRGGLNLTHSEPLEKFIARYGEAADWLRPMIAAFPPDALIAWAQGLGQQTFVGSSGRIFPTSLKASPLLRSWLQRLVAQGVQFKTRHEWHGWNAQGHLLFETPTARVDTISADATILALGGGSWAKLGSNGAWVEILKQRGVNVRPLRPSNCGFNVNWSASFRDRFSGTPLTGIALSFEGQTIRGEAVVTSYGLEGGAIYALSPALRNAIDLHGTATLQVDLRPGLSIDQLAKKIGEDARGESFANLMRKRISLSPVAINLLREAFKEPRLADPVRMAQRIKSVPIQLIGVQTIERVISSAGGIDRAELRNSLELKAIPNVYAVGEMVDWEAPTGGYLLQACFAMGVCVATVISQSLAKPIE